MQTQLTANEWTDASETVLQNEFGWTAYLRIKHNRTQIFILLDFITDQSYSLHSARDVLKERMQTTEQI